MRIVVALEYDGSAFAGWQSQPSRRGAQDVLERAVASIAGSHVRVAAAGRTDRGVHATSQIAHFDVEATRPDTAWVRGVNAFLPGGIAVLWARPATETFHARFSARARHYTYLLLNRPVRPALFAGRVGWHHRPLDALAMHHAAQALLGYHDFSSFRAAECQSRSPMKTLHRIAVERTGDLIRFEFCADAFLHHMIRNIIGTLLPVGAGTADVHWPAGVLAAADRKRAGPTFAPDGLYLTGVDYPAEFGLPPTRRPVAIAAFPETM